MEKKTQKSELKFVLKLLVFCFTYILFWTVYLVDTGYYEKHKEKMQEKMDFFEFYFLSYSQKEFKRE